MINTLAPRLGCQIGRAACWPPTPETTEARILRFSAEFRAYLLADLNDLCSNHWELPFTPVEMRNLAVPGDRNDDSRAQNMYRDHELSKRLGGAKVDELVRRAQAGESVRSLARELGVANSALTRMLREHGVDISKRKVTDDEAAAMTREYEAGSTIAGLEKKYGLSHGAVLRALHRCGAKMRASAPRRRI